MEKVREYFDREFTFEENEWDGIYWSSEILDGNCYGFVFSDGALYMVYEKAPSEI